MMKPFHILVTDTNLHVRNLLKRELQQDGHTIYMAKNKKEVHDHIHGPNKLDIIILDPEVPDLLEQSLLNQIQERAPKVKIIIHTFIEFFNDLELDANIHFVEKSAISIGPLKKEIAQGSKGDVSPRAIV